MCTQSHPHYPLLIRRVITLKPTEEMSINKLVNQTSNEALSLLHRASLINYAVVLLFIYVVVLLINHAVVLLTMLVCNIGPRSLISSSETACSERLCSRKKVQLSTTVTSSCLCTYTSTSKFKLIKDKWIKENRWEQ